MEIKINTKTVLWIVLAIIVLFVIWQTMQISAIGSVASPAPTGGGMVGGC